MSIPVTLEVVKMGALRSYLVVGSLNFEIHLMAPIEYWGKF